MLFVIPEDLCCWLCMTSRAFELQYDGAFLDQGLKYAYPDAHDSFSILVYATEGTSGHWLFLQPFRWEVWVMLLVAGMIIFCLTSAMMPAMGDNVERFLASTGFLGPFVLAPI